MTDSFADALPLAPIQNDKITSLGSSTTATTEPGEPLVVFGSVSIDRTRWATFTPQVDGRLTSVSMLGLGAPARWLTLYSGDGTLAGLVERANYLAYNEFWIPFNYDLNAGETYWLQVGTEVGAGDYSYDLKLTFSERVEVASDWIQGPDFVRDVGALNVGPGGRMLPDAQQNGFGVAAIEGAAGGFNTGLMGDVQNAAMLRDQEGPGDGGPGIPALLMNATHGYFEDNDSSNYYAWSQATAFYISAWMERYPPPVDITDDQYDTVEWESDVCEILGGEAEVDVVNGSYDASTDPPSPVLSGDWTTQITAVDGVVWDLPASVDDPDHVVTHDLANESGLPIGAVGAGRVITNDVTDTLTADVSDALDAYGRIAIMAYLDSSDLEPPNPAELTPNSTEFTYGALLTIPIVNYLMRPPRHRFTGVQWVPYIESPLRRFGRGGNLALGSGRVVGNNSAAETLHVVGGAP